MICERIGAGASRKSSTRPVALPNVRSKTSAYQSIGLTVSSTGDATVAGTVRSGIGGATTGATAMTLAPTRATPAVAYGRIDASMKRLLPAVCRCGTSVNLPDSKFFASETGKIAENFLVGDSWLSKGEVSCPVPTVPSTAEPTED